MLGALAAYAVRVYGYTRLEAHTVWWVLALEPLHGITFALAWTAFVDKVKAEVPEAWHTSGQLALNTAMNCVGRVAGSLIGGFFILHGASGEQSEAGHWAVILHGLDFVENWAEMNVAEACNFFATSPE